MTLVRSRSSHQEDLDDGIIFPGEIKETELGPLGDRLVDELKLIIIGDPGPPAPIVSDNSNIVVTTGNPDDLDVRPGTVIVGKTDDTLKFVLVS